LCVALLGDGAQQRGQQAELFKRRSNDFLLRSAWEGSTFDRFRQMRFRLVIDGPRWTAKRTETLTGNARHRNLGRDYTACHEPRHVL
jgi:hypothetical protein